MLIKNSKGWELPESAATSETAFMNRRQLMKGAAAGTILAAAGPILGSGAHAATDDPSAHLYPVDRNPRYTLDRPITPEEVNSKYNNFYEFGSHKEIWRAAQRLPVRPWTLRVDGMVENEMEIGIDDLLAKMPLEERLYPPSLCRSLVDDHSVEWLRAQSPHQNGAAIGLSEVRRIP